MFLKSGAEILQPFGGQLIKARLARQREQLRCQLDGEDLRHVAILKPIGVEDGLGNVGVHEGRKRS
jgi:hypothetical protein